MNGDFRCSRWTPGGLFLVIGPPPFHTRYILPVVCEHSWTFDYRTTYPHDALVCVLISPHSDDLFAGYTYYGLVGVTAFPCWLRGRAAPTSPTTATPPLPSLDTRVG